MQGYVAEIIWDANSGEIIRVGRNTSGFSNREKIAVDGDSLIRLAEGWLRDLGIAPPGSVWRQIGKLEPVANSCIVRFISQGRFATLKLDIRSGSLITAEQWPRQSNHRSGVLE